MTVGTDGFLYPNVNTDNCIQCLACETACPVLRPVAPNSNRETPAVYACWNKDSKVRAESSSGGAFSALATSVFAEDGYVAGATYDKNMLVRHQLCHSTESLHRLRGSKYVQSDIGTIYRDVKEKLNEERSVLFVGTPCQVAGLRAYLKKDFTNLYCCDFICHGTPSPLLFRKYIHWVGNLKRKKIYSFNFRHKRSGWYDALRAANGNYYMKGKFDAYFLGFNRNISLRESCYRCPAIGLPRKGDITIADYWGIGMKYKFDALDEIPNGISLVMINNEKGAVLFDKSKTYMYWKQGNLEEALSRNQPMIRPSHRPKSRDTFYVDMQQLDFELLRQKYFKITGKAQFIAWFRENAPRKCVTTLRKIVQIVTWKRNGSKAV
jgi:coenzyme F420-reducing hydrogenase beta subunit